MSPRSNFFCIVGLYTHIINYIVNFRAYAPRDKSVEPDEHQLVALALARWALESAHSGQHTCDPGSVSRDCLLLLVFCRTEANEKTTRPSPFSPGNLFAFTVIVTFIFCTDREEEKCLGTL